MIKLIGKVRIHFNIRGNGSIRKVYKDEYGLFIIHYGKCESVKQMESGNWWLVSTLRDIAEIRAGRMDQIKR